MTAPFLIPALRADASKSVAVVDRNVVTQEMAESDMAAVQLKLFSIEPFQQIPEFIRILVNFFLLFSHGHLLCAEVPDLGGWKTCLIRFLAIRYLPCCDNHRR